MLGAQELQAVLTSITDAEAALPSTASWVTAELIEGAAYAALPTPKAGVLTAITNTVTDLNSKITTVSPSPCRMPIWHLCVCCESQKTLGCSCMHHTDDGPDLYLIRHHALFCVSACAHFGTGNHVVSSPTNYLQCCLMHGNCR